MAVVRLLDHAKPRVWCGERLFEGASRSSESVFLRSVEAKKREANSTSSPLVLLPFVFFPLFLAVLAPDFVGPEHSQTMAPVVERASQSAEKGANSLTRWVEANRNLAIALGLGTIAVGGAGAYYYLNGKPQSGKGKGGDDASGSAGEKSSSGGSSAAAKKKKSKKSKKTKEGNTTDSNLSGDGPLLDEASDQDLMALSEEEIAKLPEEVRGERSTFRR